MRTRSSGSSRRSRSAGPQSTTSTCISQRPRHGAGVGLRGAPRAGWRRHAAPADIHRRHGRLPLLRQWRAAMMIATEDLMHMLEEMGISTGVDLYKLVEVVWACGKIVGHPLYGFVSKAGPRRDTTAFIRWICRASKRSSRQSILSWARKPMRARSRPGALRLRATSAPIP